MTMNSRASRGRFLGAAAAAAVPLFGAPNAAAQSAAPPLAVRAGATSSDDSVSVVYAQRAGWFRKAGLDVTVDRQNSGAAVAAAVASGTYAFGKSSLPSLIEAHERGIPFVLVAPGALYDVRAPYSAVLIPKDSPVRSGKDANGMTFAVAALSDLGHVALQAWVDRTGGDSKSLHYVEIPFAAVAPAVEQGRVAGGEVSEPTLAAALATGKFRALNTGVAIAPSFYITAWFTTRDFSDQHPEVVRTFARVVAASAAYTNAHHDETAPIMADYTSVPLAIIGQMSRAVEGTTLHEAQIQPLIDASLKYGTIKRSFPARELIDSNVRRPL
jgi:NitT/TauT family transport system substrate-binding protein